MKYRTTKKAVTEGYSKRISIGYCGLQNLLEYVSPVAYTAGVYGWNADIYEINPGTAIVTGYNPFGNVKPDYETVKKYNDKAAEMRTDYSRGWSEKRETAEKLLQEFVKETLTITHGIFAKTDNQSIA